MQTVTATEIEPDAIATIPINKLAVLRAEAFAAMDAVEAIADITSLEFAAAYQEAMDACKRANAELERLAKNRKTRYGSWRTPADVELMALGLL